MQNANQPGQDLQDLRATLNTENSSSVEEEFLNPTISVLFLTFLDTNI